MNPHHGTHQIHSSDSWLHVQEPLQPGCTELHHTPRSLEKHGSIDKVGSMMSSLGESQWEGGFTPGMRGSFVGDRVSLQ